MVKKGKTTAVNSVEEAEKIVQSNVYDEDFNRAIAYLQKHAPESPVLAATIAGWESSIENLQKQMEQINAMLDSVKKNQRMPKRPSAKDRKKTMSDDAILANANEISSVFEDEGFYNDVMQKTVVGAKPRVAIVGEDAVELSDEQTDKYWFAKMQAALHEVTMARMDDATFSARNKEEKVEILKNDAVDVFWTDLRTAVAESAVDTSKSAEDNELSVEEILKKFNQGHRVDATSDSLEYGVIETKRKMDKKAAALARGGKSKSGKWLKEKAQKFGKTISEYIGTPAEIKQAIIGYFSTKRGITNTAVSLGLIGTSMISMPVAIAAAAGYGLYHALAPSQWSILEKRNANLKAARAKGDPAEIKVWEGEAGLRHAYKAIQANPKEKARYDRQKRTNLWAGLGSAAIVAAATPFVLTGGLPALGIGAAAAWGTTRMAASSARVLGTNTNAFLQMQEAIRQDKEDKTAESAKGRKRAIGAFGASMLFSGLAEYWMGSAAMNAAAQEQAFSALDTHQVAGNQGQEDWHAPWQNPEAENPNADPAVSEPAPEVASEPTEVAVPQQYSSDLHATESEWKIAHKYGNDVFEDHYRNVYNAQQANPNLFVHADGSQMSVVEAQAKGQVILEGLAKEGKDHHFRLFDENHQEVFKAKGGDGFVYADGSKVTSTDIAPECWGNEERVRAFRAIYKVVDCGDKADISSEQFNALYNDAAAGTGNAYAVTNECGDIAWYHKLIRKIIHKPADQVVESEAVVVDKPEVDTPVKDAVVVEDKVPQDQSVDDGVKVWTKVNRGNTTTHGSILGVDETSVGRNVDKGVSVVPNSMTNIGREVGGR